ncbi:hypothetical protein PROFUN_16776, partial [Planoprotostelium fungivorum]
TQRVSKEEGGDVVPTVRHKPKSDLSAQHLTSLTNWKTRRKVSENSATKKHIQCTFIEKEYLGFLWFEIILYKQRLIELFGSYVVTIHHNVNKKNCLFFENVLFVVLYNVLNL